MQPLGTSNHCTVLGTTSLGTYSRPKYSEALAKMTSDASDATQAALAERERGNAFYKSGDLIQGASLSRHALKNLLTEAPSGVGV